VAEVIATVCSQTVSIFVVEQNYRLGVNAADSV